MSSEYTGLEIAVIGMAGRFPGAPDVESFWRNLAAGREAITFFSRDELLSTGIAPEVVDDPHYVAARGVLAGADRFDAEFFGYSPREAEITDPQQRLLLECAWEALENAAYDPARFDGLVGVYAGAGMNQYLADLWSRPELVASVNPHQVLIANDKDHLTTRISYKLGLEGPAVTVQTACSTSLVAVHLACQSLLNGECDMALAGGISAHLHQEAGYRYQEGMVVSPDGHCRAFDSRAQGTVSGSGLGLVVLRRLEEALAAGDEILAVIRGSAINNDGSEKIGYTAPRIDSQAKVIRSAQMMAEVGAETLGYVEAHGTGTALGDPIEVAALSRAFAETTDRKGYCALGSVKTNIGHLDAAAGIAGLIKTVLALDRGQVPPSLNFQRPNPKIDFEATPFFVNTELRDWPRTDGAPRRAGVSSFGIGGTNAHVVLEEGPERESSGPSRARQVLVVSAKTEQALERAAEALAEHLEAHPELPLADVAHTLQVARQGFEHRRSLVCAESAEAVRILRRGREETSVGGRAREAGRSTAFVFPGQGSQYPGMAAELYDTEPVFREHLERCRELLRPALGLDPLTLLWPGEGDAEAAAARLEETALAQPLIFAVEYALAELWRSWGVEPAAMIGHSVGEYVAACLAGVFDLGDALSLMVVRGRLMAEMPTGAMLSVALGEDELELLVEPRGLAIAALNAPERSVVAGPSAALEELVAELEERGVECRRLRTSHAFHSPMMEPVLERFAAQVREIGPREPALRFVSNLTGDWIRPEEATDPGYWAAHLRRTVRFAEGLERLAAEPGRVLLEIGPGPTLTSLASRLPGRASDLLIAASLRRPKTSGSDQEFILRQLGRLWESGVEVDWRGFSAGERRRRLALPTYPFERASHRITAGAPARSPRLARAPGWRQERFAAPSWRQAPLAARPGGWRKRAAEGAWLIFLDEEGLGSKLAERLTTAGAAVAVVEAGAAFERLGERAWKLEPGSVEDHRRLLAELAASGELPARWIHCWSVTQPDERSPLERLERHQERGFWSLLGLAQALGERIADQRVDLVVVSNGLQTIAGEASSMPEKATLLGPCQVIPKEIPQLSCRSVDVELAASGSWREERSIDELLDEAVAAASDAVMVAHRGGSRWLRELEPLDLPFDGEPEVVAGGAYLITGGLGAIGLALAETLACRAAVKLVLLSRGGLPPRETWAERLEAALDAERPEADSALRARIRRILELEEMGADVLVCRADVADAAAVEAALAEAESRFGPLRGVIHAAGVAGGGVIQRKERSAAEAVLRAKVEGTLVLDRALRGQDLDFFVLCSSVTSLDGAFGQVDYSAANVFLDVFAQWARLAQGRRVTAINWDRWRDQGMGVDALDALGPDGGRSVHPLLGQLLYRVGEAQAPRVAVFASRLTPETCWPLGEHRLLGRAILPGTAYLEMATAAYRELAGDGPVEVRDVFFWTPMVAAAQGGKISVLTFLERRDEGFAFRITSVASGQGGKGLVQHASGQLRPLREGAAGSEEAWRKIHDLQGCPTSPVRPAEEEGFGPRWWCLDACHVEGREILGILKLDPRFHADLDTYRLHPALLDGATSLAGGVLGGGAQIPISYRRMRVWAPLRERIFSWSRARFDGSTAAQALAVDLTITDGEGRVLVEVEEFTKRRIAAGREEAEVAIAEGRAATGGVAATAFLEHGDLPPLPSSFWQLLAAREHGLGTAEAREAFERLLAHDRCAQVVVRASGGGALLGGEEARAQTDFEPAAPPSSKTRAEPIAADDLEGTLSHLWREVLGVEKVAPGDNFFELGGDSILALQVVSKGKELGLELTPNHIFDHQSFGEQLEVLRSALAEGGGARASAETGSSTGLEPPPIERVDRSEPAALSFSQQRIWFLQELDRDAATYNVSRAVRIEGPLDREALRQALEELLRRHEPLRTRFVGIGGKPRQIVDPPSSFVLPRVEMGRLEEDQRLDQARAFGMLEAARPFDLTRSPQLRALLFEVSSDDHVLVYTMHHIISDDDAIRLFMEEVTLLYAAFEKGEPSPLPDLPLQYVDYAAWQRNWFQGEVLERSLEYWRRHLSGNPGALELPAERTPPPVPSHRGRREFFELPRDLYEGLQELAKREGVTVFMGLMAVFVLLLSRHTGEKDVVIGADVTNRNLPETERMMGFFINMLVLRTDLEGELSFRDLLGRVREVALGGFAHREFPYERLVEALRPERGTRGGALFKVVFNFVNRAAKPKAVRPHAGDLKLRFTPFAGGQELVRFDLMLQMGEEPDGIVGAWVYSTDLYEPETIARLHGHFETLLCSALENPQAALDDLEMLTAAEREEMAARKKARSEDQRSRLRGMKRKLVASGADR